jgi:hypothetical protein
MQRQRRTALSNANARISSTLIAFGVFPREQRYGMNWRMDVSYQVEQPTESNTSLCRITPASHNTLIYCYGCEDILLGWLHGLDACWLGLLA